MDVVRTGELYAPPQRVEEAAALDEGGRNGQAKEREPGNRHEVDPREVAEEPRQADRQERDEAGGQRDEHIATAADRPHERNGAAVRRGEDERPDHNIEDRPHCSLELSIGNAKDRGPDAKSE